MIWLIALFLVLAGHPQAAVWCCLIGVLLEPRCRCTKPAAPKGDA